MGAIVAGLLTLGLFLAPLVARIVFDRRAERAAVIGADVRAVVRHRLGGESMVSVQVESKGLWSPGRVRLSTPSGYEGLIEKAWPAVVACIPAGYELIVRPAPRRPAPAAGEAPRLSRAA
jgi:hypothetical protein